MCSNTYTKQGLYHHNNILILQMRVSRHLQVSNYSLKCMQFPVLHAPGYYREESHGGWHQDVGKRFQTQDPMDIMRP